MDSSAMIVVLSGALCFGVACAWGMVVMTPIWDQSAVRLMGSRIDDCVRLGYPREQIALGMRLWGLLLIANLGLFWLVLHMLPVGMATTWLVYVAPKYVLDYLYEKRKNTLRDQMVSASVGLASTVEAGMSLPQGLDMVAKEAPRPLSTQLQRIVADFNRGRPLRDAIHAVRQRLQIESFTLFAAAVQVAIDRGGPLNLSLDRISRSLQENQRLERRLQGETAAGRRIVQILALFPLGFLVMLQLIAPAEVRYLYTTLIGQLVLTAAILIDYVGVRMAVHLIRLEA